MTALAATVAGLLTGLLPDDRWPLAGFLMVFAIGSSYYAIVNRLVRRRARRLKGSQIPWGVRLQKPLWISLKDGFLLLGAAAALGAVPAALAFPGVGVGICSTLVAFVASGMYFGGRAFAVGLTFEKPGLRVHLRGAQFLMPWSAIAGVNRQGPDLHQSITLRLFPGANVVGLLEPPTARARERLDLVLGYGNDKRLWLPPWTAGLDGATLARALREGLKARQERLN